MATTLDVLDAACAEHLQHDAMGGADSLSDETMRQLQQAAQAAGLATAGQVTADQAAAFHAAARPCPVFDRPVWYVVAAVLGALSAAIAPLGCAG